LSRSGDAYEATDEGGYIIRAPVWEDLESVLSLIRECEAADEGEAESTADDLRGTWERERFELENDAWVVTGPDGRLAGYVDVWDREPGVRFVFDGYVRPEFRGQGIGTFLVRASEGRASERGGATATTVVFSENEPARRLLTAESYAVVQHFWRMVIEMKEAPQPPKWPTGVSVKAFKPGRDDRPVHAMIQEAFADNHQNAPISFEGWRTLMIERESFDPSLWFLATAGDQIVGAALCPRYPGQGWVRQLAVKREWRRKGVALALLRAAFGEFHRRGERSVGLTVNSFNRTGAKEFYERAGMRVERQHERYEKALGPPRS